MDQVCLSSQPAPQVEVHDLSCCGEEKCPGTLTIAKAQVGEKKRRRKKKPQKGMNQAKSHYLSR